MSFNDGSHDDDITQAETPDALFRKLLEHFDGVEESITKIFPSIKKSRGLDRYLTERFCEQLLELARCCEDLSAATEVTYLSGRDKGKDDR